MPKLVPERQDIVSLSVVKNEGDIIESMVRSNLVFVDVMFFIDNGSVDGTLQILQALAEETGRVKVSTDMRVGHLQQEIINTKLRNIADNILPKHVLLLDGDEILIADQDSFRDRVLLSNEPLLLPWRTFVPTPLDEAQETNPVCRIIHRRQRERPQFYKVTVPNAYLKSAKVVAGSHSFKVDGKRIPIVKCDEIVLGHWPVRSVEQLIVKALIGSWNMKQRRRGKNEGLQWHKIAEAYLESGDLSEDDFYEVGLMYAAKKRVKLVREDVGITYKSQNKFDHLIKRSPLYLVARFMEEALAQR